jgi:quercetin dioxygenase-like cupin family protein
MDAHNTTVINRQSRVQKGRTSMRILPLLLFLSATSIIVSAQDPIKVDPAHYHVLFENAHMRVLEYRAKPGDAAPMHSHPAYMIYVTAAGRTKVTLPNGEMKIDESAGSEFECLPPTQHATENVGTTDTQELIVEFKDATDPSREANSGTAGGGAQSETEILKLQETLIDGYIHRDIATLDRILADEYTFVMDDGMVADKRQFLESFKSGGDRQITSYKRQDDKVRIYGDVVLS